MEILGFFVLLLFLYTLVARRLEERALASPTFFTPADIVIGFIASRLSVHAIEHEATLLVATIALVPPLFTEASKAGLPGVVKFQSLPTRLPVVALPLTILFGAIGCSRRWHNSTCLRRIA